MFQRRGLRCSFCGKGEAEVSKLVAGPRVYICDGCVAVASRLMENPPDDDGRPPEAESSSRRRTLTRALRSIFRGDARRASAAV